MNAPALHAIPGRTKTLPPLRVGVGGPVGSGKTTLLEMLCKTLRERWDLVVITNDIYTKEDQRLLTVSGALPPERILGVETGGCPHTAIREDASINLEAVARLNARHPGLDVIFIESGGFLGLRDLTSSSLSVSSTCSRPRAIRTRARPSRPTSCATKSPP